MAKKSANKESYKKVFTMLKDHNKWFEDSIPLIASENIPSPAVREAIISDFGNRYAEGWPGERVYAGCVYTLIYNARRKQALNLQDRANRCF